MTQTSSCGDIFSRWGIRVTWTKNPASYVRVRTREVEKVLDHRINEAFRSVYHSVLRTFLLLSGLVQHGVYPFSSPRVWPLHSWHHSNLCPPLLQSCSNAPSQWCLPGPTFALPRIWMSNARRAKSNRVPRLRCSDSAHLLLRARKDR